MDPDSLISNGDSLILWNGNSLIKYKFKNQALTNDILTFSIIYHESSTDYRFSQLKLETITQTGAFKIIHGSCIAYIICYNYLICICITTKSIKLLLIDWLSKT